MRFSSLANMPIFRRLFLSFFLAVLIPDSLILLTSLFYTQALVAHGMNPAQTSPFTIWTMLALVISTGVVIGLGSLMNRTITQPLSQLARLARRITQGDMSARAHITGRDEIAVVATSFNDMLDRIVSLLRQTQGQHDDLQGQVERLIGEVSGVGEGDLSLQAEVTHGSLGVLADTFNYMVEQLSSLVIRVKRVALQVESATTATQHEMGHLVSTAETQLEQMDQTTSTIEVMAQSFLQVAERTQILDHAARAARQTAQQGRQTVGEALEGMEHIYQHTRRTASQIQQLGARSELIDQVVGVLEHIAHQTTRLALDAAIQVAMAGETTNTGFGVVAEGMRRLSEETKVQLTTVARTVKSVRTEILTVAAAVGEAERETATGVARIQATGSALVTIFTLVEQQAAEIGAIHQMTEQLLRSARSLSAAMHTISGITTQTSASTRMVAQQMQQLALLALQLRTSVEVFTIKDSVMPYELWNQQVREEQQRIQWPILPTSNMRG
jgi:methyl-accepting chemotaxis protein